MNNFAGEPLKRRENDENHHFRNSEKSKFVQTYTASSQGSACSMKTFRSFTSAFLFTFAERSCVAIGESREGEDGTPDDQGWLICPNLVGVGVKPPPPWPPRLRVRVFGRSIMGLPGRKLFWVSVFQQDIFSIDFFRGLKANNVRSLQNVKKLLF